MAAECYNKELSELIGQLKLIKEDGYISITMNEWKEVKALLKKTIIYLKESNKNKAYPAVVERLEKIADELFDLGSMTRDNSLALTILDEAAAAYQYALDQYNTSPDTKYAKIAISICLVYHKKIEVRDDVNCKLDPALFIKEHKKIIEVAERIVGAAQINHATMAKSKIEARAYLFTSYYYLYQHENGKTKENNRVKFLANAREFIALAVSGKFYSEFREDYAAAQKAIAQYSDENLAPTQTKDPKIKETAAQFEIASHSSKANVRKAMPSAVGIFSDQGIKKRKTTDTRNLTELISDAVQNGAAKLSATN